MQETMNFKTTIYRLPAALGFNSPWWFRISTISIFNSGKRSHILHAFILYKFFAQMICLSHLQANSEQQKYKLNVWVFVCVWSILLIHFFLSLEIKFMKYFYLCEWKQREKNFLTFFRLFLIVFLQEVIPFTHKTHSIEGIDVEQLIKE